MTNQMEIPTAIQVLHFFWVTFYINATTAQTCDSPPKTYNTFEVFSFNLNFKKPYTYTVKILSTSHKVLLQQGIIEWLP